MEEEGSWGESSERSGSGEAVGGRWGVRIAEGESSGRLGELL